MDHQDSDSKFGDDISAKIDEAMQTEMSIVDDVTGVDELNLGFASVKINAAERTVTFKSSPTSSQHSNRSDGSYEWVDLPPGAYDVMLSDVNEATMPIIEEALGVNYLHKAEFPADTQFPAFGQIMRRNDRWLINLVCRVSIEHSARNIIFVVDTGAPITALEERAIKILVGKTPPVRNNVFYLEGNNVPIIYEKSKDHYKEANILGSDALITLGLLEVELQFKFFLNLYFLCMALSQFISAVQIGSPITYWGPLGFVLTITLIRETFNDIVRQLSDQELNSAKYAKITTEGEGIVEIKSASIEVGDLIMIEKDRRVAVDVVLVKTTKKSRASFALIS